VTAAGGVIALVALAAGIFIYRSLGRIAWAPLRGADTETASPRPASPTSEMEAPALPAFPRPEDRAGYEKGRRLLAAGDAKGALGALTEAARRLPREPVVVHDYGLALVRAGEQDLGLFQLEYASRLAPGIGSYRLDLIHALIAAGRRGPAARELQELLTRDPSNLVAAQLLATITEGTATAGGVASPGAAGASVDLGGAAVGAGSPRPVEGGGAFTNEDLARRRTAPPAPVMVSPTAVRPSASSPAQVASPSPPA
jgi:tetratricopeptide (TPR) repeat protein